MERLTLPYITSNTTIGREYVIDKGVPLIKAIKRLGELEDKLESGRLVECGNEFNPKFAIYEDVYIIDYVDENNFSLRYNERNEKTKMIVRKCFVTDIIQHTRHGYAYWIQPRDCPKEILDDCTYHNEYWDRCWSEYELFKTKEQAEARLKELRGE